MFAELNKDSDESDDLKNDSDFLTNVPRIERSRVLEFGNVSVGGRTTSECLQVAALPRSMHTHADGKIAHCRVMKLLVRVREQAGIQPCMRVTISAPGTHPH